MQNICVPIHFHRANLALDLLHACGDVFQLHHFDRDFCVSVVAAGGTPSAEHLGKGALTNLFKQLVTVRR
jgi:hypothetical protein